MFDINEALTTAGISEDMIDNDSIEGCDHVYAYFDNGLALSVLRGTHPSGRVFGNPDTGTVEVAVLKMTLGGLAPHTGTGEDLHEDVDAPALAELASDINKLPDLSFEDLLGDAANIIRL